MEWTLLSDIDVLNKLSNRLKEYRLKLNKTQREIAEWAGVSLPTVQRFETGKPINMLQWVKILRALDLLENFGLMIPEPVPSPRKLEEERRKKRKQATGLNSKKSKRS